MLGNAKSTDPSPKTRYRELAPQAPQMLQELIRALGYPVEVQPGGRVTVSVETLALVAGELSALVSKEPAWGRSYLSNVLNRRQPASALFVQAIVTWGAVIDGTPAILANTQDVLVRAKAGQLHPGSVVLANSQRCPGCQVAFVPTVPWQRYCRPQCRRRPGGEHGAAHA